MIRHNWDIFVRLSKEYSNIQTNFLIKPNIARLLVRFLSMLNFHRIYFLKSDFNVWKCDEFISPTKSWSVFKLYSGALSFITFSIQFGGLGNQILVGASLTSLDLDIIFVFTIEVWHLILFGHDECQCLPKAELNTKIEITWPLYTALVSFVVFDSILDVG